METPPTSSQAEQEFPLHHTLHSLCLCLKVKLHVQSSKIFSCYLQESSGNREISFVSLINGVDSLYPSSISLLLLLKIPKFPFWNTPCPHVTHVLQVKWTPTSAPGAVFTGVMESHRTCHSDGPEMQASGHQLRAHPWPQE